MPPSPVEALLRPRAIALVGVSARGGTGARILQSNARFGFEDSDLADQSELQRDRRPSLLRVVQGIARRAGLRGHLGPGRGGS